MKYNTSPLSNTHLYTVYLLFEWPKFVHNYTINVSFLGQGVSEASPDFKLMLLCVQAVTTKDVQNLEKQERKKQFQVINSVTHTKPKLRSV